MFKQLKEKQVMYIYVYLIYVSASKINYDTYDVLQYNVKPTIWCQENSTNSKYTSK